MCYATSYTRNLTTLENTYTFRNVLQRACTIIFLFILLITGRIGHEGQQ